MKRLKMLLFMGLVFGMLIPAQAAEDVAYHKKMYRLTRNIKEKRDYVKTIYSVCDDSYAQLILDILDEQLNYGIERNRFQKKDHEEWLYYTSLAAGKLRLEKAGQKIKVLTSYVNNSIFRGSMIYSIGLTKDKDLIPWLNLFMNDLNQQHALGKIRGNEELVIGAIKAIGEFNDVRSFRVMFYASIPNYPDNIRTMAREVFEKLTDDPAAHISHVINYTADLQEVLAALTYVYKSQSSDEGKAKTAIMSIHRVLDTAGITNKSNEHLGQEILDTSVVYLGELKSQLPEAVKAINAKWDADIMVKNLRDENMHSVLKNAEALAAIANDEANAVLTKRLKYYNDKSKEGAAVGYGERDGGTTFFAIIDALGEIGSSSNDTYFELKRVADSTEYGEPHKRRAKEAIEKLKR